MVVSHSFVPVNPKSIAKNIVQKKLKVFFSASHSYGVKTPVNIIMYVVHTTHYKV